MNANAPTKLVILLAATLVVSMTATAFASDRDECSLARAAGKYSFNDSGRVIGIGPRVATGIFTLDAAGNLLNGKATSSLNDAIADEVFSGPYTVNSDCTGTFVLDVFDPSGNLLFTAKLNLAWDDNMRELRFIFTSVTTPDGKRLSPVINGDARKLVP
jgi:hypothetical protein